MKIKFTIIDYIIIILVICAVVFAFIHITSDDSSKIQKTAFDASTVNKIYDTYSNYYKDGYIVKTTVNGYNATNGEEVTLNGTVKWISTSGGNNVKILFDSNNETYLTGLYQNVPRADIYLDKISLENDGSKYDNLVEITAKSKEIKSLADLTNNLSGNYEITTTISADSIEPIKLQEINNAINEHGKRSSVKASDIENQIYLDKSDETNINDIDTILGNINGITGEITIRIYNCSDSQLNQIKNNFEVTNIRNF